MSKFVVTRFIGSAAALGPHECGHYEHVDLHAREQEKEELTMLRWALLFLVVALIAGALGLFNVSAISGQIAWILFVIFLILFLLSLVMGGFRRGPPL